MLGKPEHGWCTLTIGDFEIGASYLTDVAVDFLNALIKYHPCTPASVFCDAESDGWFYVMFTEYEAFVIGDSWLPHDSDKYGLLEYEISVKEVALEIYNDIMSNILDWARWDIYADSNIGYRIESIKNYIKLLVLLRKVRKKFKFGGTNK